MKPKITYLLFKFNSLKSTHVPPSNYSKNSKNIGSELGYSSFSTFSIGVYIRFKSRTGYHCRGPLEKKFHKGAVELVKGVVSETLS